MRRSIIAATLPVLATGVVLGTVLGAGPAQAATRPPWHVTIHASATTVSLGQRVVLTGHVSKAAAGKLVVLQQRANADGTWHDQANALVHRDGDYRVVDRPTVNKHRDYRVVMPATPRHRRGVSPAVGVGVYAWTSLTTLPSVNAVDFDAEASVSMNGVTYPSSLEAHVYHYLGAPTSQSVEYNLGHLCTRFRATFGLADDSVTGSQATVTAAADGTPWFTQTFGLGQTAPNRVTFATPPLKIRFESTSTVDGADGLGAVGTPEVYCTQ
jgi:hypothetical protein